jgi:uncharacterized protein YgiM (DUF1202 family)
MIRRTLTGGLLATVAMLALVPTAADAAPATPAARPVASAGASHLVPSSLPTPDRNLRPARHVNRRLTHHRSIRALGRVTTHRTSLNVRSGPGTGYRVIGVRHAGRVLALKCRAYGSWVRGTHQWYRLAHVRGYVSAHYVRVRGALPWC